MSDNPRLNPIIVVVPVPIMPALTVGTSVFLRTDLGGQVLDKTALFTAGAGAITADGTNYTTVGVKVGSQAVGLSIGFNLSAGGGSGNIAAFGSVALKSGGTAAAQVALRQWPRGTSTDIGINKADTGGSGMATLAGQVLSLPIMQSAYDPLS